MTHNSTSADQLFSSQYLTLLASQISNHDLNNVQQALFEKIPRLYDEINGTNDFNMLHYSARKMVQSMANHDPPDESYDIHSPTDGPGALIDRYIEVFAKEKNLFRNSKPGKKIAPQNPDDLLEVKLDSFVILATLILRGATNLEAIEKNYGQLLTTYLASLVMDIIQSQLQLNHTQIFENNDMKELTAFVSRMQVTHKFSRKFNHFVYLSVSKENKLAISSEAMNPLTKRLSSLPTLVTQAIELTLSLSQCTRYRKENHIYLSVIEEQGLIWSNELLDELATQFRSGISLFHMPFMYNLSHVVARRVVTNTFKSEANYILGLKFARILAQRTDWKDPILSFNTLLNCFISHVHHNAPSSPNKMKPGRQIFAHLPDLPHHKNSNFLNTEVHLNTICDDLIYSSKVQLMENSPPVTFISDSMVTIMSWLLGPPANCLLKQPDPCDIFSSLKHVFDSTSRNETLKSGILDSKKLGQNLNYLLFYSCWESMRYCFISKFKTPYGSVEDLLTSLQNSLDEHQGSSTDSTISVEESVDQMQKFYHNLKRKMLVLILDIFEKLLKHYVENPTSDSQMDEDMRSYYVANEKSFTSLVSSNRLKLSRMALESKSYADAWQHASMSLYEFSLKSNPSKTKNSPSEKDDHLEESLRMLCEAAKGLKNTDLLHGIDVFVSDHISRGMPHLKLEISNLECRFEDTLKLADEFISGIFNGDYVEFESSLQDKILKLAAEASINLGRSEEAHKYVDKINDNDEKSVFTKSLKLLSLTSLPTHRELITRSNYDVVKKWLSSWDDEHRGQKVTSGLYPLNLDHYLLASISRIPNDFQTYCSRSLTRDIDVELNRISTLQAIFHPSFYDSELKILYFIKDLIGDCNHNNPTELTINRKIDDTSLISFYNYLCYYQDILRLSEIPQHKVFLSQLTFPINCLRLKITRLHKRRGNAQATNRMIDLGISELNDCCESVIGSDLSQHSSVIKDEMDLLRARFTYEKVLSSGGSKYSGLLELKDTLKSFETQPTSEIISLKARSLLVNVLIAKDEAECCGNHDALCVNEIFTFVDKDLLSSKSLLPTTKVKALETLSAWAHTERKPTNKVYELAFETDLMLLESLESCHNEGKLKRLTPTQCALRVLSMIREYGLTEGCRDSFQNESFIRKTIDIWVQLASQLLSITLTKVTDDSQETLEQSWQSCLFNMLKKICCHSPHALVYPVIVGNLDFVESLQHSSDQISVDTLNQRQTVLKRWLELKQILQKTLSVNRNDNGDIVGETEKFIKELRKITSLWGEHLFNVSGRIMQRIQHLLKSLQELKSPSDDGKNTSDEKQKKIAIDKWQSVINYSLSLMKTIMSFIERQAQQTVSSKYETWFCSAFSKTLLDIMAKLDQINKALAVDSSLDFDPFSESNLASLINIGGLFDFCRHLVHEYNKDNRNKLYMEVISPTLSRLDSSCILMPGCSNSAITSAGKPIFISKVKQVIRILISKTCPKKLTILGSDGKNRSFILKGHEDLRLDKHIMQVFSLINQVLAKNKSTRYQYSLRHYAVTPLSTRSGLIQWIDAPPIYSFYRAWLSSSNVRQRIEYQQKPPPPPLQPLKPHEIFYNKLTLLGNQGVAKILSVNYLNVDRKKWNTQLLVKVLAELEKETPDNLISDHLWIKSVNAHDHWTKTQSFIHSCSVMSMVGYIIGLGDRHMDNILLDSTSGEVIHIDYNMSFDMARTWLRIPEQVPFRLTQNFIRAFGFAGLEGGFTRSCEKVLNILKENKATLLYLLNPSYWEFIIESDEEKLKSDQKLIDFSSNADILQAVAPPVEAPPKEKEVIIQETIDECTEEETSSSNTDCEKNRETIDKNAKLASQNLDYQDGFDLSQTLNMQNCIKTPTRLTKTQALDEFHAIESKLDGTDELVCSYHYQQKTVGMKPTPDLIGLIDSHTTEEQVEALIHAATSSVNKARMYEGWTPWV